jgi:sulfite reductase alpha subunit-like flavoprotein
MDDYDISQLPHERYVVMIVATAGDGETPATMRSFWRFLLNKSLSASSLQGMNVGVFGLGDSSYAKFNACARRMTTRLQQLGAHHCVPLGLGDDQAGYGYYTAWNDWIEAYLSAITALFPPESVLSLAQRQLVTTAREYRCHFNVHIHIFAYSLSYSSKPSLIPRSPELQRGVSVPRRWQW